MIRVYNVGSTIIAVKAIDTVNIKDRRNREKEAVSDILKYLFGEKARLVHDADGAPLLDSGVSNISVSHSRDIAVVASDISRRIGIDAETWRDALYNVRGKFLTEEETLWYDTPSKLLNAWTAKEAVFKVAGVASLSLQDIYLTSDLKEATAAGKQFFLNTFIHGSDTLTLAFPTSN